jgi:hypothetical protein
MPFFFSGDSRHRAGWYSFPFWDDGWRSEVAELGPRPQHRQTAAWREITSVSSDRDHRREPLEVRQAALDERMNRIHDKISEHTAETIQGGSRSSSYDRDDWDSRGYDGSDW